ncbi:very short patch repair endonuclease [Alienimonas chondri]|uniref:Very short patch repair endonuclease n=1 Tax=Alienimonas chondri TaxID=2681879 RepID=A0ABX1VI20_9PLAN|nr:DNA mismatch endonuclease Vsr [Alienimonas chondri]NNJ27454.1 Very short patch repair protein [Alienimonas chondri]
MADSVDPAVRSAIMRAVRAENTAPEMTVRKLAHRLGLRFRLHRRDLPGTPDLVFPGPKKVVFVHGCFWHRHPHPACRRGRSTPATRVDYWQAKFDRNVRRDRRVQRQLREAGWGVMVVWECQTKAAGLERLAGRLQRFVKSEG